ncbi:MAG TPA: Gfo/Idh/MocA family oxidoreductase [Candidatus Baltobacteraceae bacterium]|jgi:predicted dehydrogenase|nr:Gfo/Idh/MocA family oxidoreductase [Candidatus Baltobacteraceae bacterium]
MSERELNAAIVGLGYWGPNLLRNFTASTHWNVRWIVDADEGRLARMQRLYPRSYASRDFDSVIADPDVDLVAIATPPSMHAAMAGRAIAAGKHVLVEKPLAENSTDARRLVDAAERRGVKLFTDHTFLYTGAVEAMHRLNAEGALGEMYYAESQRVNLGLFQQTNVIWDLGPHDVSILNRVFGSTPEAVSCQARACVNRDVWDMAFMLLRYGTCVAQVHLSWLSPVKVRRMMLSASARMLVWDDVDPSEKVRIYDKGVVLNPSSETLAKQMVSYRLGEVRIPMVDDREALGKLIDDAWESIVHGRPARVEGAFGYDVVCCLEAACASARADGKWIEIGEALAVSSITGTITNERAGVVPERFTSPST